ncbi:hypothetical protein OK348_07695 [Flavobacterium sp. MXW15]|uniref:DUF2946 domain-containing protein n=1 Tax=Xanthomonas chitinilytica TaxID=2989819 RepID=A0ABT3JTU3_9XANT|nr:DUF2946 family protein [Xanthomonas sp. H13-6]MCW4454679.1 hypothetical protein [Flavobacterium sp. MXW15]MCW4471918.1 hypothetical protein [Xanthomonas sp. H13-6]
MRTARFQSFLLLLAFAAALLMAVAPVVSRWVQAQHATHAAMPATAPAVQAAAMEAHAGHHGMAAGEHAHHGMDHGTTAPAPQPPADPHAAHGEACEYCTLASRLLPWLALLLVLAPLLPCIVPAIRGAAPAVRALRWPAHAPRGPPRLS